MAALQATIDIQLRIRYRDNSFIPRGGKIMSGYFWRIWAVALVLSIVWLGWCMKSSQVAEAELDVFETISAKEFRLVDDAGTLRARFATPLGTPSLNLSDSQGKFKDLLICLPNSEQATDAK